MRTIAFALLISGVSSAALLSSSSKLESHDDAQPEQMNLQKDTLQAEDTSTGSKHSQQILLQNTLEGLGGKTDELGRSDQKAQQILLQNTLEGLGSKTDELGRSDRKAQQVLLQNTLEGLGGKTDELGRSDRKAQQILL